MSAQHIATAREALAAGVARKYEAIPCAYGCGTMMSAEHAEGGVHYERHRYLGDRRTA